MPEYENGKQTHQKILEASRILFWEKGYGKTRFEDYYQSYGIRTGLVHYHFQKKEQLALLIYSNISMEVASLAETIVSTDNFLVHYAMIYRLMWHYYDSCPEFARFVQEALKIRVHATAVKQAAVEWYRLFNQAYSIKLSETQLQIRALAAVGGQVELIYAYLSGELNIKSDEMATHNISNALQIAGVPEEDVQRALRQSLKIMNQYQFTMDVGFKPKKQERNN